MKLSFKKLFITIMIIHGCVFLIGKKKPAVIKPHKMHVTFHEQKLPPKPLIKKQTTVKAKKRADHPTKKQSIKQNSKKKSSELSRKLKTAAKKLKNPNSFKPKAHALSIPKPTIEIRKLEIKNPIDQTQLVSFLRKHLKLPEVGAVKMKLTISPEGRIKSLQTLSKDSEKNNQYLKNTLPELQFPCFNESVKNDMTFEFLFRNERT